MKAFSNKKLEACYVKENSLGIVSQSVIWLDIGSAGYMNSL